MLTTIIQMKFKKSHTHHHLDHLSIFTEYALDQDPVSYIKSSETGFNHDHKTKTQINVPTWWNNEGLGIIFDDDDYRGVLILMSL